MTDLQHLIVELGLATVEEINQAIFSSPDTGVIQALENHLPQTRAERLLPTIAQRLQLEIADPTELYLPQSVSGLASTELVPLVSDWQALPFYRSSATEDGEQPTTRLYLAMADPLNEQGIVTFAQLLGERPTACLARLEDIRNACALQAARLSPSSRQEALEHPEAHLPAHVRQIEDPEVRKAVQQVTATAVKHRASIVHLDLASPFTRATFQFENGQGSHVDISVSPIAFLASLLRRGQMLVWEKDFFQAMCRVRFKSVSVNLVLECAASEEKVAAASSGFRTIILRDFQVDSPDNPGFWRSIEEEHAAAINHLLEPATGMLVLASNRESTREFALRSFGESYADATCVDLGPCSTISPELLRMAEEKRVIVGLRQHDVFGAIRVLSNIAAGARRVIRGVVAYHQLPRNCPFCSIEYVPTTELLTQLPPSIHLGTKDFRHGQGCEVCAKKGVLGFQGISSFTDFSGLTGEAFRKCEPPHTLFAALARDCFQTLLQNGVSAATSGKVTLDAVMSEIPKAPEDFVSGLPSQTSGTKHAAHVTKDDKVAAAPVCGRDAFLLSPPSQSTNEAELELKLQSESTLESRVTEKQRKRPPNARPTILVIDDDADQRAILRRVFEIAGYQVEVAADGIDGIVSAVRIEPELIIVDFMMPELDGRETVRRLKQGPNTERIPIVALTAYADPEVELGLLQAGADDFCAKSVSKQVLLKRVQRLIGVEVTPEKG